MKMRLYVAVTAAVLCAACGKQKNELPIAPIVFSASGDVNAKLNELRTQLGPLNTTTGQTMGRREINWDGVPDDKLGIKLPADFFNPTGAGAPVSMQRGLLYAHQSDAVVSKTNFVEINNQAAAEFASFSGNKSFAVINTLDWPVEFNVAGTNIPATIKSFGAVFTDVDKPNSTFIEFFSESKSMGKYFVPVQAAGSKHSLLAVYFSQGGITHVRVGHEGMLNNNEKDISQGGAKDLVVLDDFIYSEPLPQ